MGSGSSKETVGGSLKGAYMPPLADTTHLNLPRKVRKSYTVTIPPKDDPRRTRDEMNVEIDGRVQTIAIPYGKRAGDTIRFTVEEFVNLEGDGPSIITSTLPSVPGMQIIMAKPIIFGNVTFYYRTINESTYKDNMGAQVAPLLQEAQEKMIEQVLAEGCNACLGMSFNVTVDSQSVTSCVIVTAYGTPCIVVKQAMAEPILVEAHAEVIPMTNFEADIIVAE